jgi:hypothetical protein
MRTSVPRVWRIVTIGALAIAAASAAGQVRRSSLPVPGVSYRVVKGTSTDRMSEVREAPRRQSAPVVKVSSAARVREGGPKGITRASATLNTAVWSVAQGTMIRSGGPAEKADARGSSPFAGKTAASGSATKAQPKQSMKVAVRKERIVISSATPGKR